MNRKIFAGVAAVGILAGGAWADFVIEDFSGERTAFGDYSGAFTWGDAVLGNPENPYSEGNPWLTPNGGYGELISVELGASGAGAVFVKAAPGTPHAITECTGISFKLKNSAIVQFAVEVDGKPEDFGQHVKNIPVSATAKVVSVPFSDLSVEYGPAYDLDLNDVSQLSWSFKAGVSGSNVTGLSLEIDDITCLTSGGSTPSSSSAGGGSSSSTGGGNGSGEVGYYIAKMAGEDGYSEQTAYDDYVFAMTYGTPKVTIDNEKDSDGYISILDGVAKLIKAKIGAVEDYGGAALGFKNGNGEKTIADCDNGFSYWYKGDKHFFLLEFDPQVCGADADGSNKWGYKVNTASTSAWKKQTITKNDLSVINTWNGAKCTDDNAGTVDLSKVEQVFFEVNDKVNGANTTASLMIDNIVCLSSNGEEITDNTAPSNSIQATPIIAGVPSGFGLNVFAVTNGLSISSERSAAVSVYGLNGERVLSKRVSAGSSIVSLNNLQAGIYYVSVKAGSSSKIVKVSVK